MDVDELDAGRTAIFLHGADPLFRGFVTVPPTARAGREIMIDDAERRFAAFRREPALLEALEGETAGRLIHQMPVDMDQETIAAELPDHMVMPDFLE